MNTVELPAPKTTGTTSVEAAIDRRASRRSYAPEPIGLDDIANLLWAAQGITHERDGVEMRAAPSAGATYPLETDLEVAPEGSLELDPGVYRYDTDGHTLQRRLDTPIHDSLTEAALQQAAVADAPVVIALSAAYARTCQQYPEHGDRYVHMEAGHAAQNVQLVAESRDLSVCPVGAFWDETLSAALDLETELEALYLLPVGPRPAES